MQKTPLLVRSALAASLATASALGCSGTAASMDSDDAIEQGPLGSGSTADTAPAPSGGSTAGTAPGAGASGGAAPDGGASGATDGGTVDAGPSVCVAGATQEAEANDTPETANAIPAVAGSFCGTLSSPADVDFGSFVLPADATYLGFGSKYNRGGAQFTVSVDGTTFKIGQAPPFLPGHTYVVKVASTGTQPLAYRVDIDIKR